MVSHSNDVSALRKTRKIAALLFGIVVLLGVVFFDNRVEGILTFDIGVFIPYTSVILVAVVLGAVFAGWYYPEAGVFELVATPIIVLVGAVIIAGQLHGHLTPLMYGDPYQSFVDSCLGGLYAALLFFYVSWPILLPASAAASYWLWNRHRLLGVRNNN
jgi:hypothetical protein